MGKTIKAALFYGKEDIRTEEITLLDPEEETVQIRIITSGVCGSDVRMFLRGPSPRYKIPGILGHEFCGEIVKLGPKVEGFSEGDLVTLAPIIPCMKCPSCVRGRDNLCEVGDGVGNSCDGGMAEYMNIPVQMMRVGGLVKVPEGVSSRAASLTELVGCCLNGLNQINIEPADRVLIIGDGPIGLTFLQLLKNMGAGYIATSGRRDFRRKLAEELGADEALDGRTVDIKEKFRDSLDHVIVAASSVKAAEDAIPCLRPGGSLLLFSGYPPGSELSFDINNLHYRQLHFHGSIDCTIKEFSEAAKLQPKLSMDKLITHSFPFEKAKEAFYASKEQEAVKVVLEPQE